MLFLYIFGLRISYASDCCDGVLVDSIKSVLNSEPSSTGMAPFLRRFENIPESECQVSLHNRELSFLSYTSARGIVDAIESLPETSQRSSIARGVYKYLHVVMSPSSTTFDCVTQTCGYSRTNYYRPVLKWLYTIGLCI